MYKIMLFFSFLISACYVNTANAETSRGQDTLNDRLERNKLYILREGHVLGEYSSTLSFFVKGKSYYLKAKWKNKTDKPVCLSRNSFNQYNNDEIAYYEILDSEGNTLEDFGINLTIKPQADMKAYLIVMPGGWVEADYRVDKVYNFYDEEHTYSVYDSFPAYDCKILSKAYQNHEDFDLLKIAPDAITMYFSEVLNFTIAPLTSNKK